ncbi:MAG: aryl-sulfate sulfotransferase [Chitinispirillaceae bacterium]|nr:aryl-sulfate sulfotransferase [Chitinispirillaceae bacterium]
MIRVILLTIAILSVTFSLFAEEVFLSGTVEKKGAATGLSGANISVVKIPSLSTTTDADGKFTITGTTSLRTPPKQVPSFHYNLKGNNIHFSPVSENVSGRIDLFSSNGRKIFSCRLVSGQEHSRSIAQPELSSGISIMHITIGATTHISTLVRVTNELFMKKISPSGIAAGDITLQKKAVAAVVDTLIVTKSGFTTKKVPIDVYTKSNITIEMESEDNYSGTITNLSVRANPNSVLSAYVSWTTGEAATSKVQFGVGGVQWEIAHDEATTEHEVLVIGMRAETKYQIRAVSGLAKAETTFTTGTLPAHIPVAEVEMKDAARVQPGWTLMAVQRGDGQPNAMSNAPPTAVAYDLEGYPVWYFVNGTMTERGGAIPVDRTDKGVLMGPTLSHSPIEVDWAGNKLWSCSDSKCGGQQISHHAGKLSNGDFVVQQDVNNMGDQCWEQYTPGNDKPVFKICLSDAVTGSGMDWAHGNSITIDLDQDVAYMSSRWVGLFKMKYSTKTRIWHLPASYAITHNTKYTPAANMTFIPPGSQFSDIHDPEIHDDGTILFFDNGGYTGRIEDGNPGNYHSRAVEYAIDEEALTATLVWEWPGTFDVDEFYRTDYYVPFWGDADRLQNGNVLITAGRSSSAPETPVSRVTEVAKDDGKVVWEMRMPREQGADYGIYRAERLFPFPLVRSIGE